MNLDSFWISLCLALFRSACILYMDWPWIETHFNSIYDLIFFYIWLNRDSIWLLFSYDYNCCWWVWLLLLVMSVNCLMLSKWSLWQFWWMLLCTFCFDYNRMHSFTAITSQLWLCSIMIILIMIVLITSWFTA